MTNRDRVILEIRNMFLTGQIRPNQRLVEAELSERLGVSRTPIREAFRELEQLGLLVSEPFKGVRVADIDLNEIKQLYEVRADLEALAASLAAQRMTEPELDRLIKLNEEMHRSLQNPRRGTELNEEFHLVLRQATRNQVLIDLITSIRARIGGFRLIPNYGMMIKSARGHDEIIAALKERSPERSRQAMHSHIVWGVTQLPGNT